MTWLIICYNEQIMQSEKRKISCYLETYSSFALSKLSKFDRIRGNGWLKSIVRIKTEEGKARLGNTNRTRVEGDDERKDGHWEQ